jgi:hypothetical protein
VGQAGGWVSGGPGQNYWKSGNGGAGVADATIGYMLTAASQGVGGYIGGGAGGAVNWQDDLYSTFGSPYGVPGLGGVGGGGNGGESLSNAPHYNSTQNANTTARSAGTVNSGSGGGAGTVTTTNPGSGNGGSGLVIIGYTA